MLQFQTQDGYPINISVTLHNYTVVYRISCGSTCVVLLVEDQKTHLCYSAKIMSKKDIENRHMTNSIENEVKVLQMLDHPHIIKIEDFFEYTNENGEEYYVMILEYCSNGDLLSYATGQGFKSETEKKKIIQGFLEAVEYLHSNGISHGDIKSENILLDEHSSPKLCDFGFCRTSLIAGDDCKNGTLYYAAPELFSKGQFDTLKTDIYAVGITLYSLSELQFPFKDGDQNFIVRQIISGCLSIRNGMDENLVRLVKKCTAMNPQERPTIDDIIHDEYFASEQNFSCKINNFSAKDLFNLFSQQNDDDMFSNSFEDMTVFEF